MRRLRLTAEQPTGEKSETQAERRRDQTDDVEKSVQRQSRDFRAMRTIVKFIFSVFVAIDFGKGEIERRADDDATSGDETR